VARFWADIECGKENEPPRLSHALGKSALYNSDQLIEHGRMVCSYPDDFRKYCLSDPVNLIFWSSFRFHVKNLSVGTIEKSTFGFIVEFLFVKRVGRNASCREFGYPPCLYRIFCVFCQDPVYMLQDGWSKMGGSIDSRSPSSCVGHGSELVPWRTSFRNYNAICATCQRITVYE
jgi:hypothetical protein